MKKLQDFGYELFHIERDNHVHIDDLDNLGILPANAIRRSSQFRIFAKPRLHFESDF